MGESKKIEPMVLVGMVIAGLGMMVGAYVAFAIAPDHSYLESLEPKSDLQRARMFELWDQMFMLGTAAMGLGAVGFLLAIKSAIKTKHPLALAAIADALIAMLLGAAYSTHLFS